jgi:hypothetical protein
VRHFWRRLPKMAHNATTMVRTHSALLALTS